MRPLVSFHLPPLFDHRIGHGENVVDTFIADPLCQPKFSHLSLSSSSSSSPSSKHSIALMLELWLEKLQQTCASDNQQFQCFAGFSNQSTNPKNAPKKNAEMSSAPQGSSSVSTCWAAACWAGASSCFAGA